MGDAAWSDTDRRGMRRALRQAVRSLGRTWPNPGVGCAILAADGRLLGEGRHEVCGQAHAEINALADCRRRGHDPRGATAYVTLAPCTRAGRQPACTPALAAAGLARVVAAIADPMQDDPAPLLARAACRYEVGCLAEAALALHGGFLSRLVQGRPRLTGKWAESADGALAAAPGVRTAISSDLALTAMRRRRRVFDAILVGAGTARSDDPSLLAPPSAGRTPLRIVVAAGAEPGPCAALLDSLHRAGLLIVHDRHAAPAALDRWRGRGVGLLAVDDAHEARQVAAALGRHGLNDVLVEGGAQVHAAFLAAGLYDRLEVWHDRRPLPGGLCLAGAPWRPEDDAAWRVEAPVRDLGGTRHLRLARRV